jgi:uncharacterized metal-binding protein YceD (DUF177 family)
MSLQINLRHLDEKDLHLEGELPAAELQLETLDELIQVRHPLFYDLNAQKVGQSILARGKLELTLDCACARCLKPFEQRICLEDWALHLPLEGPEKVKLKDDHLDLTPFIREDILLEFPQRPLCDMDCAGLAKRSEAAAQKTTNADPPRSSPAWSELNKLKF